MVLKRRIDKKSGKKKKNKTTRKQTGSNGKVRGKNKKHPLRNCKRKGD
jgi:hypothetical protein